MNVQWGTLDSHVRHACLDSSEWLLFQQHKELDQLLEHVYLANAIGTVICVTQTLLFVRPVNITLQVITVRGVLRVSMAL